MILLTPEHISEYITFKYNNTEWKYNVEDNNDIPKIQAEGAAKLWNILQHKDVALLADEVGMGKTYQALAIIITLWLQKPDAKILLYAPNETVAAQWINEYETFIRYHYKFNDDKIKSSISGEPLRKAVYCENQLELLRNIKQGWPSLYICKTSTLSNFLSKKITQNELDILGIDLVKDVDDKSSDEEKTKWMYRFAKLCNDFIYQKIPNKGHTPFDLIVFDEAHYLRNADSDTNRSIVAHSFLARRCNLKYDSNVTPIAYLSKKALLLTATPNHSRPQNIENIVSVFSNNFKGLAPDAILNQICVRRFRRLNNKTKHQYRLEKDEPVEMTDIKEKLFFALYQRALVKHKAEQIKRNKDTSNNQNSYRLLYGYLEGFEFLPTKKTETLKKTNDQNKSTDFDERDDKRIIQDLAETHYRIYNKYPIHPKYNKTVENLSPENDNSFHPDKKVVFVRRIPSVFELSRRVIEAYDSQFLKLLIDAKVLEGNNKELKNWNENKLRKHFATVAKSTFEDSDDTDVNENNDSIVVEDDINNVFSKYYSLFTIKKEDKYKTTDCSNFRIRFLKELQLFSIFMHPGADYMGESYILKEYLLQGDKRNYAATVRKYRFNLLDKEKKDYLSSFISFSDELPPKLAPAQTFPTLLTIWIKTIQQSQDENLLIALNTYSKFTEIEKEAFSNYLTKGLLFSSSYLIVFYANFKSIINKQNAKAESLYLAFCKIVEKEMMSKGLALLIAKAVNTFQIFYKKELNLTDDTLLKEKWAFLNNTGPVYPVCAETNRGSILKAFNTPFYPNVLVATSVLQEGVNLHYHCNEIIHYGLAWTQGDNEQRVGRVDRLNGKMEKQLENSDNAILPIHYPYLKNTIDQDQTARFMVRKKEAEKLIDQFIQIEQSNEINYQVQIDENTWKSSFNNPQNVAYEHNDPFPVIYQKDFKNITVTSQLTGNSTNGKTILEPLFTVLAKNFGKEFCIYNSNLLLNDNKVFAINHIRANQRHQPVIAEFNYYEPGLHILGKPVYYLRVKTPIYRRPHKYDHLPFFGKQKNIYAFNPVIKICFDYYRKDNFKYFVCADLPVFYADNKQLNLSEEELLKIVNDLIIFADDLENIYTKNDIKNESIIEDDLPGWENHTAVLSKDRGNDSDFNWETSGEYLCRENTQDKFDSFNHMYYLNMKEVFVKYYRNNQLDNRVVGFYKNDALEEETKLYNYIFENENI